MNLYFLIYIVSVLVGVYLILLFIAHAEIKKLIEEGYTFVHYYMKNCGELAYYKNVSMQLSQNYSSSYMKMFSKRNSWIWRLFNKRKEFKRLLDFYNEADDFTCNIKQYFDSDHYFAFSEVEPFLKKATWLEDQIRTIVNKNFKNYVTNALGDKQFPEDYKKQTYLHKLEELRKMHNTQFVEKELQSQKAFFDTCLKYPLDAQQRKAIVMLEDNCQVISSAGSGKTSTSIAKVRYLLEKRKYKEDEILILSYNRKTSEEFANRLGIPGLTCKTFHALALQIIGQAENRRPDVADENLLFQCYYALVKTNNDFKESINKYIPHIASITKYGHEYKSSEEYFKDRETYGIMAPYEDMDGNTIHTRSEEEKKICTWLSEHDVKFRYEETYEYDTFNSEHRQYKPDFVIHYEKDGKPKKLYLEHFGIDKNHNVPGWFAEGKGAYNRINWKYNDDIRWKRSVHANYQTVLIETTSAMFHDKTIYDQLYKQLRENDVPMRLLSEEEKFDKLIVRNKAAEDSIKSLFSSFISLMKSNGKTFDSILQTIKDSKQSKEFVERCRFLMYEIIKPLYEEYEKTLREKKQKDFTDLILQATALCNSGKYKTPYKYIIVDEFQDISVDRCNLVLALRKKQPLTKTFCVGDDWQSIYRFSGSDINLFSHFEDYFGYTEKCKIETTYRFGNPLVERSSEFILKNPNQISKTVHPKSEDTKTELEFIPFVRVKERDNYLSEIEKVIKNIPASETIMLLGRYNYEKEIFPLGSREAIPGSKRATINYAGREMPFMSVHSAKGLEADNVILLNCSQDRGGFPSRIADDPILGYVLSVIDNYEYSEERRLFYVAITRAAKKAYVFYNEIMPSIFVNEMLDKDSSSQMLCPSCKKGRLKLIKEGVSINNDKYRNYNCSNSVAGCNYFWQVYYNDLNEIAVKYKQLLEYPACEPFEPELDPLSLFLPPTSARYNRHNPPKVDEIEYDPDELPF